MKRILTTLLSVIITTGLQAQQLAAVQKICLRAPVNIKIDGKANDWGDNYHAYNRVTDLYYTIANDDQRLYLIFKFKGQAVSTRYTDEGFRIPGRPLINNIVNGGIRINVQKNSTKSDKGAYGIKFPFFEKGQNVIFSLKEIAADSLMKAHNNKLVSTVKWIYTNGISGVDSVLSVYNNQGIEAANAFDLKKNYICEIAIDLKILGLSTDSLSKFSYHIIANGEPNKYSYMNPIIAKGPKGLKNSSGGAMTNEQFNEYLKGMRAAPDPDGATTVLIWHH